MTALWQKWHYCQACPLHKTRRHVVMGNGQLPCKVLLIGEAPGKAEDLRAVPFCGPSGRVLRQALQEVQASCYYITNTVACRPCDMKGGPNRKPTADEAIACQERLLYEKDLARPLKIVLLGKVAEKHCKPLFPDAVCLQHPAYVLRSGGRGSAPYIRLVRELGEVFKDARRKGGRIKGKKHKRQKGKKRAIQDQ